MARSTAAPQLLTHLPDGFRDVVYLAVAVAGVGLGSVQVAYAAIDGPQPQWLVVALAVYAYIAGAVGFTASMNVTPAPQPIEIPDADDDELDLPPFDPSDDDVELVATDGDPSIVVEPLPVIDEDEPPRYDATRGWS